MNPEKYATYALGKFSAACHELTIGEGDIKQRLHAASDKFWAVSTESLPPEIKEQFIWVKNKLTKHPTAKDEGAVIATIKNMKYKDAAEIAKKVALIESLLREHVDTMQNSCSDSWSPPKIILNNCTGE